MTCMEEQRIRLKNEMNRKLKEIGNFSMEASYCYETKTISLEHPEAGRVLRIPLGEEGFFTFSLKDSRAVEGLLDLFSVEVQRSIEKALRLNSESNFYC